MKAFAKVSVLLLIVSLFASVSFADSPKTNGRMAKLIELDIRYDGYCDGLSVTLEKPSGRVLGVYASSCAECPLNYAVSGVIVAGSPGVQQSAHFAYDPSDFEAHTILGVSHDGVDSGTYTHYYLNGEVVTTGTWTSCETYVEPEGSGPLRASLPQALD